MDDYLLKNEEKAVFALRELYRSYGYLPYKMSKFEAYDLYVQNKDFLVGDEILTFTDTTGKLLALKPDVTLSIIKNGEDEDGCKQKVCYDEHVYRVSGSTHQFKEIMQTGIECIGEIGAYDRYEVILLAAESLDRIAHDFVLEVSHLGILASLLDAFDVRELSRRAIGQAIAAKAPHELRRVCESARLTGDQTGILTKLIGISGAMQPMLDALEPLCVCDGARAALEQLRALGGLLATSPLADRIRLDFSVVNDMNYYSGLVFRGYLNGICEGVLSGGQYDKLMRRMGRTSGAIGFALYLDLLEQLRPVPQAPDVDVLVRYDASTPPELVARAMQSCVRDGRTARAERRCPERLRYGTVWDLTRGGTCK